MTSIENIKMYLHNPVKLIIRIGGNSFLKLINDKIYLFFAFKENLGYKPDFENPKTFNEKLTWLKINDHKPEYSKMVDKYEAKKFVSEILGEEYIIPTLGIWESYNDINFDELPDQFVLKCTHDSGGLIICKDKKTFNKKAARKKLEKCLRVNYYWTWREWPYRNLKARIIAEKYLENTVGEGLIDYKFFCCNGHPKMLYVSKGLDNHKTAGISFYDLNGNEMPFHRSDYKQVGEISLPANFKEMIYIAEKMAKAVPSDFVRIDLYSLEEKIYFSEITFYPCSGMIPFEPKEWDMKLGDYLKLR